MAIDISKLKVGQRYWRSCYRSCSIREVEVIKINDRETVTIKQRRFLTERTILEELPISVSNLFPTIEECLQSIPAIQL